VAEKRNMNVPDVSKARNYLACSSATRAELVVLIRKGDRIFAQVDIDSHELDAFDPAAVEQVERVADWLADAYAAR
jgi:GAF domain-containing protein